MRAIFHRSGFWWLVSISWAAFIYWLSSKPDVPQPGFWLPPHTDKVVHAVLYAILAGALFFAWRSTGCSPARAAVFAAILASLYGFTDEWHQLSIHGRSSDVFDWVADTLGATVAASFLAQRRPGSATGKVAP